MPISCSLALCDLNQTWLAMCHGQPGGPQNLHVRLCTVRAVPRPCCRISVWLPLPFVASDLGGWFWAGNRVPSVLPSRPRSCTFAWRGRCLPLAFGLLLGSHRSLWPQAQQAGGQRQATKGNARRRQAGRQRQRQAKAGDGRHATTGSQRQAGKGRQRQASKGRQAKAGRRRHAGNGRQSKAGRSKAGSQRQAIRSHRVEQLTAF